MTLKIFCISCNGHEFKVDRDIFQYTQVVKLTCPKCKHETVVYIEADSPTGEVRIYQGKP